MLDGLPTNCNLTSRMQNSGSAVQCPNNDCGPQSIRYGGVPVGWATFNGSGYHVSDGEGGAWLFFEDLQFGSLLEASKAHFANPQKKKKRRKTAPSVPEVMGPKYPPVTESDINIVSGAKPFDQIGEQLLNLIVDVANNPTCNDAFKKYNLRKPYDLILSDKMRFVPSGFLYEDVAAHKLGISQDLVRSIRSDLSTGVIFEGAAAVTIRGASPIMVIGPYATAGQYLGLRSVLIHEFIHGAGKPGIGGGTNGDLTYFEHYKEIQEACGGKSN